jgi:mono/diheme cytochrome c family protein
MKSETQKWILFFVALVLAIICGCSSSAVTSPESGANSAGAGVTTGTSPQIMEGRALYESKCSGCHGNIDATDLMTSTTFTDIRSAIAVNLGGMRTLATISDADLQMIADAINNPIPQNPVPAAPAQTGATPDGAAVYASRCAACHGAIASSNKIGTTVERVQSAIVGNVGRMGSLSAMTALEVQAVVAALNPTGSTPAPLTSVSTSSQNQDGASLYSTNCAGCHGTLASTGKSGATAGRIQTAINGNVGNMGYLSTLSATQVSAIASVLATAAPPTPSSTQVTDGATLYSTSCASCHGALASSGKAGATSSRIQTAINANIGNMGYLSTLSATQVSAIASVLTTAAPPAPTDGPGLYAANCASCHRSLANSDVRGDSAGDISEAIRKNKGGMKSLSALTSGMITAIANALKK